jgi:hypothetical protein
VAVAVGVACATAVAAAEGSGVADGELAPHPTSRSAASTAAYRVTGIGQSSPCRASTPPAPAEFVSPASMAPARRPELASPSRDRRPPVERGRGRPRRDGYPRPTVPRRVLGPRCPRVHSRRAPDSQIA